MPDMNENAETQQEYFGRNTKDKIVYIKGHFERESEIKGKNKQIADLEKENAELKEINKMLEQGYVWHDYDAGEDCYEDSHEGKWVKRDEVYQLTKAKKLLGKLVVYLKCQVWIDDKPIMQKDIAEAEQFIKDSEVEKC